MINKIGIRLLLIILSFFVTNITFGQELMNTITDEICQEIDKIDWDSSLTDEEFKAKFSGKFEQTLGLVLISYANDVKEIYKIDVVSDGGSEEFGELVALELAKKCPVFLEIAMRLYGGEEEDEELTRLTLSGKFVRLEEKGDFVYLIIKDADKRDHKLLWYGYFEGSNKLTNGGKKLKGKKVKVTYIKTEVYSPRIEDYRIIKQMASFELN